jgi:hypothetical protein
VKTDAHAKPAINGAHSDLEGVEEALQACLEFEEDLDSRAEWTFLVIILCSVFVYIKVTCGRHLSCTRCRCRMRAGGRTPMR